jgi:hypothetical protein
VLQPIIGRIVGQQVLEQGPPPTEEIHLHRLFSRENTPAAV